MILIPPPFHQYTGVHVIFVAMPQAWSPQQMVSFQAMSSKVWHQTRPLLVVKLSSFGIDGLSGKHIQVRKGGGGEGLL